MPVRQKLAHLLAVGVFLFGSIAFLFDAHAQTRLPTFLAFQSNRDGNTEIYLMTVVQRRSQNLRNLTEHPGEDTEPVWVPDGRQIAFLSDRDGNVEIYLLDREEGRQINLTNHSANDFSPTWSPDGQQIAFVTNRDGFFEEIYVMNADGGNQINLTKEPRRDFMPTWSPDGDKIAFVSFRELLGASEIYVMDPDGANPLRLTETPVGDIFPDWSPDSERLIWLITNPGVIAVMNAEGGAPLNLTDDNKSERGFWSPDGQKIAFLTQRDDNQEIYVMDSDGRNQLNLSNHKAKDYSPAWAPDSTTIAFVSERDGNKEIYIIDADAKLRPRNLTNHPGDDANPAWSPVSSLSVSPTGKRPLMWGELKESKLEGTTAPETAEPNARED